MTAKNAALLLVVVIIVVGATGGESSAAAIGNAIGEAARLVKVAWDAMVGNTSGT